MKKLYYLFLILLFLPFSFLFSQSHLGVISHDSQVEKLREYELGMEEAIELAQLNSIASMQYKNLYVSYYWNYRSYKASRLPSLMLSADIANFNRSITQLQDSQTGEINYRSSNNMSNMLKLSIDQVIFATGGSVSLYTSLERLDQFGKNHYANYYSQPISLSYIQPFFAYNPFKWSRKIEPQRYEMSKREYMENMELVTLTAVKSYWNYAYQSESYNIAKKNYLQSKELYATSEEKFKLGTINKSTLLQIKLKVFNDSLSMNNNEVLLISSRNKLSSFIGIKENVDILTKLEYTLPEVNLKYLEVLEHALKNSSFTLDQQVSMLEAQQAVAIAKGERGFSVRLSARFGLSNDDERFKEVYRHLQDQEVVGLNLNFPIYDWGVGNGKVQMAKAKEQTKKNELEQAMVDYQQSIFLKVMQFNNQKSQCDISFTALVIAKESYELAMDNFLSGSITVTDLNSVRNEYDTAQKNYILSLSNYWEYYYDIRRITLHDYQSNIDISAEFDKLIVK